MGAVVGSESYKDEYVSKKVEKWIQDIEQLANVPKDEPQEALSSFTKAIFHRWTFVQRTVPYTSHLFQPLEDAVTEKLIPALIGRHATDIERILALPVVLVSLILCNLQILNILHRLVLLEILPILYITRIKILPTTTDYKLIIT